MDNRIAFATPIDLQSKSLRETAQKHQQPWTHKPRPPFGSHDAARIQRGCINNGTLVANRNSSTTGKHGDQTMQAIRSILWMGPEAGLVDNGVLDEESLDVVWVRDVAAAATLPIASFEALIIAFSKLEEQRAAIARLANKTGLPPIIVLSHGADAGRLRDALSMGSGDILYDSRTDTDTDGDSRASFRSRLLEKIDVLVRDRKRASQNHRAVAIGDDNKKLGDAIIGESEAIRAAYQLAEHAAGGTTSVLLYGETGTGKEVFAKAIHRISARRGEKFVAINCAAIPDTLLESELFGHVRGAFTGANTSKAGLFEVARGGTLFLDEIGETSASLQAKLLRALQEKEIRPVGSSFDKKVDVRIIAASNRDLRVEATRGTFREDLYYRLAVFPLAIPPLRKRGGDILLIAQHFLRSYCRMANGSEHSGLVNAEPVNQLSQSAAELLVTYPWPGNVRELENEMQRALTLAGSGTLITPDFLSESVRHVATPVASEEHIGKTLRQIVAEVEAQIIRRTLANNGGRRARSARDLGITREGLYKKMKRLGVE
ncbi:MAG: DNA-binding NtrC family response regulator [Myxococcota bacterium]|jgi:DNA-binding NtrC family response regulator